MSDDVKLTEKQYSEIKSLALDNLIHYASGENDVVKAVVHSFLGFCNRNNYVIQNGKVLQNYEEKKSTGRV